MLKLTIVGGLFSLFLTGAAAAQTCASYPNTLSNGTTADANQVMANFNSIQTCANTALAPLASPHFTGNVTIATPSSGLPLDVAGIGRFMSPNAGSTGGVVIRDAPGNPQLAILQFVNNANTAQLGYIQGLNGSGINFGGGNVGVGTTTPNALLDLGTAITTIKLAVFDSGGTIIYGMGVNAGLLTFGSGLASVSAAPQMVLNNSGYLGIGTTAPGYPLYVAGTAYATGAAGALSDIRHKDNVRPLAGGAVEIVGKLRPVTFVWKKPTDDGMKGEQIGFIAQDMQKVLPSVVLTENNAERTLGIKYNELIPVLTKAIQEQQSEIEQLRGEVAALKARR